MPETGKKMGQFALLFLVTMKLYAWVPRTGDIILQPLSCFSCWLIEKEERGPFSHMGMIFVYKGQSYVFESLRGVDIVPLKAFLGRPTLKRDHVILRSKELNFYYQKKNHLFRKWEYNLLKDFLDNFYELPYDDEYLWFNSDEKGNEKLYCSEMVTKLLNPYLSKKIETKKMHFKYNREHWYRLFKGHIPDGQLGNSPMDFFRSDLFEEVGVIKYEDTI